MRKLFTEYSTQLVYGICAVLVLMRLILPRVDPNSATAKFILWFWHPDARRPPSPEAAPEPTPPRAKKQRSAEPEPAPETDWVGLHRVTITNMNSTLAALVIVLGVIRPLVIQAFFIPSASMEPTLWGSPNGRQDRVLVNKYIYALRPVERGDIIVFHAPPAALNGGPPTDFIKRVIGIPGDLLSVEHHQPVINGQKLLEPYVKEYPDGPYYAMADGRESTANFGPITIPDDCYFMMGDNRANSHDSRAWGEYVGQGMDRHFEHEPFIHRRDIVGLAMCVFWPPVVFEPPLQLFPLRRLQLPRHATFAWRVLD